MYIIYILIIAQVGIAYSDNGDTTNAESEFKESIRHNPHNVKVYICIYYVLHMCICLYSYVCICMNVYMHENVNIY
jgi:hypothetical protein